MKCPNCGKELAEGERFCINCGTNVENYVNQAGQTIAEDLDATVKAEGIADAAPAYQNTPAYVPPAPQQPYVNTAAPQPTYHNPAAANVEPEKPTEKEPKAKRNMAPCKPLSTWSFIWRTVVSAMPVIGLIVLLIMAFAKNINANSKSFARSRLIFRLILFILCGVCVGLFFLFQEQITNFLADTVIPALKDNDVISNIAEQFAN